MKRENLAVGRRGEAIARKYLRNKKYKIIEQNYRTKYSEIDLVARDKKTLVFVEVRTKRGERFGSPEESFNHGKINRLIRNALAYTARKNYRKSYRIDALCIVLDEKGEAKRIAHYPQITLA